MTSATNTHPIEQLERIAAEFHHWSNEYKREGDEGTTRRTIEKRLEDLDNRFNSLLQHWVSVEPKRKAWQEHLHHEGPRPDDDLVRFPPVFIGESASGSELQVRPNAEGSYDIIIDGTRADRMPLEMSFPKNAPLNLLGQEWVEIANINETALEALRNYHASANGGGTPPWQWARVLYGDGLIDANFSLTPRGQRILER
jgi:hypothetical protein